MAQVFYLRKSSNVKPTLMWNHFWCINGHEPACRCNKWTLSQSLELIWLSNVPLWQNVNAVCISFTKTLIRFQSSTLHLFSLSTHFLSGETQNATQKKTIWHTAANWHQFSIPYPLRTRASVLFSRCTHKSSFTVRPPALWQAPVTMTLKKINVVLSRKLPYICMKITYICHGWLVAY